jgi:DNA-binding NarL/FixJ family response regulator
LNRSKVLIVQNDPGWQTAVSHALHRELDLVVIGAAHSKEDAVHFVQKLEIDVVLINAMLNGDDAISVEMALEIHALHTSKMIILTFRDHRDFILEAFSNGVTDLLLMNFLHRNPFFGV